MTVKVLNPGALFQDSPLVFQFVVDRLLQCLGDPKFFNLFSEVVHLGKFVQGVQNHLGFKAGRRLICLQRIVWSYPRSSPERRLTPLVSSFY